MANITPTVVVGNGYQAPQGYITVQWTPMANGDVGLPPAINTAVYGDVAYQVAGTFGTGGSVAVEGSCDGTNYAALRDPQGTTIAMTAASIKQVLENVLITRPHVTAGDGTTALTVTAFYRRTY